MKLQRKLFLFSIGIATLVGALFVGYMVFLMPSMYLDYRLERNRDNAKKFHQRFVKEEPVEKRKSSYEGDFLGVILPKKGYVLQVDGNYFSGQIEIPEGDLRPSFDRLRGYVSNMSVEEKKDEKDHEAEREKMISDAKEFLKKLQKEELGIEGRNILDRWKADFKVKESDVKYEEQSTKLYPLGKHSVLGEFEVEEKVSQNHYTTFLGFGEKNDQYYITVCMVATPSLEDIRPVVFGALPMMIFVIIILGMGISWILGRSIVYPITSLAQEAEARRLYAEGQETDWEPSKRKDEIGDLEEALRRLYLEQEESYEKLEDAARRKEVFMRASSHQLKTPLAAATLLIDGMMSNTGKFADRDRYLPESKKQLVSMRRIIDEILNLNRMGKERNIVSVSLEELVKHIAAGHQIMGEERKIKVLVKGGALWETDGEILFKILDNLIKNAILYTEEGGIVEIELSPASVKISNSPAEIKEQLLDSIFEPFVSGNTGKEGHGLGLYVAKYFAEMLGMKIQIESKDNKVEVCLEGK